MKLSVETSTNEKVAWKLVAPSAIRSGLDEFALNGLNKRIITSVPLTSYVTVSSWAKEPESIFVNLKVVGPSDLVSPCKDGVPFVGSWDASPKNSELHGKTEEAICAFEFRDFGKSVHVSMVWACLALYLLLLPILYHRMKQLMN